MDFIPEVKMDFIPSDGSSDEEGESGGANFIYSDEETTPAKGERQVETITEEIHEEKIVPEVKKKSDSMVVEDIFTMPENVKLTKSGKPRKKRPPMTESQKEKLKLAREKGQEARKRNAIERKRLKALDSEEKELLKKQKVKQVQRLKEEVEEDVPPRQPIVQEVKLTKKDLEDAQLEAIIKYETLRKARKKEKQVREKEEGEKRRVRETLLRQVTPQQEYNPFQGCY